MADRPSLRSRFAEAFSNIFGKFCFETVLDCTRGNAAVR